MKDTGKIPAYQIEYQRIIDKYKGTVRKGREAINAGIADMQTALDIARKHSDQERIAESLFQLALCHIEIRSNDQALHYLYEVLELVEKGEAKTDICQVLDKIAYSYWSMNEFDRMQHFLERMLELQKERDDRSGIADALLKMGSCMRFQGKLEQSIEYYEMALEIFVELNDVLNVNLSKSSIANLLSLSGKFDQAISIKKEIITYFESVQDNKLLAREYNMLSVIYIKLDHRESALEYSFKAIRMREEIGDRYGLMSCWINLGVLYKSYGDDVNAEKYYQKARDYCEEVGDKRNLSLVLNNLGIIQMIRNNNHQALECFEKSRALKEETNDLIGLTETLQNIGLIYADKLHDYEKGLEYFEKVNEYTEKTGDRFLQLYSRMQVIDIKILQGKIDEAHELFEETHKAVFENKYDKLYTQVYSQQIIIYSAKGKFLEAASTHHLMIDEIMDKHTSEIAEKIAELHTKYNIEQKEKEAEIYRLKNVELEAKNRQIEKQKVELQKALDDLHHSEIRYHFVTEELTRHIRTSMIGQSESICKISEMITMVARSEKTNVLITGETGTGKEIVARNIHACSKRSRQPFYAVNCSAIPDTLFESHFFGHEKNAFTGATSDKIGWFEIADKSTLFLDEIGTLSLEQQAKLLRSLEERKIVRVGSLREIPVDLRIVSATNNNLMEKIESGQFRSDLYHRLAIFVINIPPLRERKEDIPLLLEHFVGLASRMINKKINRIEKDIAARLLEYDFPGNVRELKNMVERAVVVADSSTLRVRHFLIPTATIETNDVVSFADAEKTLLLKALRRTNFNRVQAAKLLDVERKVVERKMKKYNIEEDNRN